jgi:hypothetical protein
LAFQPDLTLCPWVFATTEVHLLSSRRIGWWLAQPPCQKRANRSVADRSGGPERPRADLFRPKSARSSRNAPRRSKPSDHSLPSERAVGVGSGAAARATGALCVDRPHRSSRSAYSFVANARFAAMSGSNTADQGRLLRLRPLWGTSTTREPAARDWSFRSSHSTIGPGVAYP